MRKRYNMCTEVAVNRITSHTWKKVDFRIGSDKKQGLLIRWVSKRASFRDVWKVWRTFARAYPLYLWQPRLQPSRSYIAFLATSAHCASQSERERGNRRCSGLSYCWSLVSDRKREWRSLEDVSGRLGNVGQVLLQLLDQAAASQHLLSLPDLAKL